MRLLCLLLLAWALPASAQVADDVRGSLDDCLRKLSAVPRKDFEAISSLCSSLPAVVEKSPYTAWLPQDWWQEPLDDSSLQEFASLIDHLDLPPAGQSPDLALLAPTLEEIRQAEILRTQSWIERFKQWLRERLQPNITEEGKPPEWWKWFTQLAQHATLLEILSYVLLVLVVATALGIVYIELKAAGVFDTRARGKSGGMLAGAALAGIGPLEDIDSIDPLLRPSRLLDRVLSTLAGPQRARIDRARTHRELREIVRFDEPVNVQRFENLARCAERVRYSPAPPVPAEIDRAVASGQELLGALEKKK